MAEIEFKRRGTPLWAVVLALLIVAAIVWALVVRRHAPAAVAADSAAAITPTDSAKKAAGAKAAARAPMTAPAAATGPSTQFAAWTDSAKMPAAADAQPAHIGEGLQLLAGALAERVPLAGVQVNMIRAMADTLRMPSLKPSQYLNATQAAFFAAAYALRQTSASTPLSEKATAILLTKPLAQQASQIQSFFATAGQVLKAPIKPQSTPAPPGAPPSPTAKPAPQSKS